jgi:hypothetical protein
MDIKLIAKLLVVKTQAKGALQVTRRPDTLVSPVGRPGPEQRRDLIGARRLPGVTPHSIVRPLPLRGLRTDRDIERSFLT